MSKLRELTEGVVIGAIALLVLGSLLPSEPPPPPPVVPKNAIAVTVCGVIPSILVAYSDGSVRNFEAPFKDVPKAPKEWTLPIAVLQCEGKVQLQSEVF